MNRSIFFGLESFKYKIKNFTDRKIFNGADRYGTA